MCGKPSLLHNINFYRGINWKCELRSVSPFMRRSSHPLSCSPKARREEEALWTHSRPRNISEKQIHASVFADRSASRVFCSIISVA